MKEKKVYSQCAEYLEKLISHLSQKYKLDGYDVQAVKSDEETYMGYIFQVKDKYSSKFISGISKLVGFDTAVTAKIIKAGMNLEIEVGGGKWLDKAAVAGWGAFISFSFLLIPAGIGTYRQKALIDKISDDIDNFLQKSNT